MDFSFLWLLVSLSVLSLGYVELVWTWWIDMQTSKKANKKLNSVTTIRLSCQIWKNSDWISGLSRFHVCWATLVSSRSCKLFRSTSSLNLVSARIVHVSYFLLIFLQLFVHDFSFSDFEFKQRISWVSHISFPLLALHSLGCSLTGSASVVLFCSPPHSFSLVCTSQFSLFLNAVTLTTPLASATGLSFPWFCWDSTIRYMQLFYGHAFPLSARLKLLEQLLVSSIVSKMEVKFNTKIL